MRLKSIVALLCLGGSLMGMTQARAEMIQPDAYLRSLTPPVFAQGHGLPRLTRYGWTMPFDTRVELAKRWGYALELGGYTTPQTLERIRNQPESIEARCVELAVSDPRRYALQVICSRELPNPLKHPIEVTPNVEAGEEANKALTQQMNPDTGELSAKADDADKVPDDPFVRDASGELVGKHPIWSPEAPQHFLDLAAKYRADPLRELRELAPIAIVLNGGEYALGVAGFHAKNWAQDPRIMAAKGNRTWFDYISQRKAEMELTIATAVRRVVPDRQLYIYYVTSGGPHRNRYGGWEAWSRKFEFMRNVSDLPSDEFYWMHFNSGYTGDNDMLTMALNAKGHEIDLGAPLNYNWLCAGWPRDEGGLGPLDLYMGFLKCLYTTGMLGGNAGYYAYPKGGFDQPIDGDDPPHWIRQMVVLSRVHAMFSHLEPFVRDSYLLPGPDRHVWSKDQPAYEFPTGGKDVRVVARRRNQSNQWLVCAWAAGGTARDVSVTLPDLGEITLHARPVGSVYLITPGSPGTPGKNIPVSLQVDPDADHPSAHVPAMDLSVRPGS